MHSFITNTDMIYLKNQGFDIEEDIKILLNEIKCLLFEQDLYNNINTIEDLNKYIENNTSLTVNDFLEHLIINALDKKYDILCDNTIELIKYFYNIHSI